MDSALETREKRPTLMKGVAFIGLLLLLTALLVAAALTRRSPEGPLVATAEPAPISVAVQTVVFDDRLALEEAFSGLAVARRTSTLGFSANGRIASIRVDVGDRISKGQTLARLDTRDLQANLAAAKASIAEAQANFTLAQATVTRQETLLERGHVSQQRVDEAVAQASASAARIEASMAQAEMLRVAIDLAGITAPYDGVVTNRMVDEGAIAGAGTPILEIVEADKLEARIGLPGASAAELVIGETYVLTSDRGPVEATLRADTGVIDRTQRTIMTVFDIADASKVSAGAVVRLSLERDVSERGFWVPVSALSEASRGLWSLYVVDAVDGGWVTAPRLVEIVHSEADRAFVRGTLDDGDRVITDGLRRLVPGQRVVPSNVSATANAATGG
ncbi:MAG: efflux RND transporter periplasmic adaptor subunit [Pseudomonadota bacterium]